MSYYIGAIIMFLILFVSIQKTDMLSFLTLFDLIIVNNTDNFIF